MRSMNRQTLDFYRNAYVTFSQFTNVTPWHTKEVNDLLKSGFSYAYSRANTQSIGCEYTTAIDSLSALYNCMILQHEMAYDESDPLQKVRELIKAQFYAEEAVKYYKHNKSLLTNVSPLYGESFFLACKNLIEGERYETQAVIRSQKNDVVADPQSFE